MTRSITVFELSLVVSRETTAPADGVTEIVPEATAWAVPVVRPAARERTRSPAAGPAR